MRQCIAGVPIVRQRPPPGQDSRPPSWWGRALQEFHGPLPPGGVALHCRSCTAHCPQAAWQCTAGVALPIAPRQCGSALQGLRSLGSDRLLCRTPRPPSWGAAHCRNSTAHRRQAVWQCTAGIALPNAARQCGSALQELHCPMPPGSVAVHCRISSLQAATASWAGLPPPHHTTP